MRCFKLGANQPQASTEGCLKEALRLTAFPSHVAFVQKRKRKLQRLKHLLLSFLYF